MDDLLDDDDVAVEDPKVSTVNNGWTTDREETLHLLIEENHINSLLTEKEGKLFKFYNNLLMIPILVLTGLVSLENFNSNQFDENTRVIFNVIGGICGLIVFTLGLIKQFYDPSARAEKLSNISKTYQIINKELKQVLREGVEERENGTLYLRKHTKKMQELIRETPEISTKTKERLIDEFQKGKFFDMESSRLFRQAGVHLRKKRVKTQFRHQLNDSDSTSSKDSSPVKHIKPSDTCNSNTPSNNADTNHIQITVEPDTSTSTTTDPNTDPNTNSKTDPNTNIKPNKYYSDSEEKELTKKEVRAILMRTMYQANNLGNS